MQLVGSLILAGAVIVAVTVPLLAVWVPVRAIRGRARLRRAIEVQGYRIRRMELRWLTRGPFADMRPAGLKFADWLYRAAAEDRDGNPRVAWIRWRPGMPWQPDDRWELRWDESPDLKPRGLPTVIFGGFILAGTAIAIALIVGAARDLDAARAWVAHDDIPQRTSRPLTR